MTDKTLLEEATLYDVVQAIESSRRRMTVVVDGQGFLLGTLTDGDVRRSLLAGGSLETLAIEAMNKQPVTAPENSSEGYLLDLMRASNVLSIPLYDTQGKFVRLTHVTDLSADTDESLQEKSFHSAVIMAGGDGARLRPLTQDIPKPMVEIGGIPLLERQIRQLAKAGVQQVFLSVNYLSHVIEDYFGDGADFGVSVGYLKETKKLGTAGAISLLPDNIKSPILVMNGDILTKSDFANLYAYHEEHNASLTVSAIEYIVNIPYGVIHTKDTFAVTLEEKPTQRFRCNAGIYALSDQALELIPRDTFYNLTDLVRDCLAADHRVSVFPVHEYWSDIGTPDDLEKARAAFEGVSENDE